jgi:hypothetical protein
MFRVAHAPWEQCPADGIISSDSLLRAHFPWFANARFAGANYSPGVRDVRMGWPLRIPGAHSSKGALARQVPNGSTLARAAESCH